MTVARTTSPHTLCQPLRWQQRIRPACSEVGEQLADVCVFVYLISRVTNHHEVFFANLLPRPEFDASGMEISARQIVADEILIPWNV